MKCLVICIIVLIVFNKKTKSSKFCLFSLEWFFCRFLRLFFVVVVVAFA